MAYLPKAPRYEFLEEIGGGGFARVYRARQVALDRIVAVKCVFRALRDDEQAAGWFRREAELLAALRHPNIVALYDFLTAGPDALLVMEFVAGRDLAQELRQGPVPPERAMAVLREVAAALTYAGAKGVVHRDVKPANVLLGFDGSVKLGDFGIAKMFGADLAFRSRAGTVVGTPRYMAPEQLGGEPSVGPQADAYSFAVMAYELLTGSRPAPAPDPVRRPSEVASHIPRRYDGVLMAGVVNPAGRRPTPEELVASLAGLGDAGRPPVLRPAPYEYRGDPTADEPVAKVAQPTADDGPVASPAPAPACDDLDALPRVRPPVYRPRGRRRRRTWLVLTSAVGVVAVGLVVAWGERPSEDPLSIEGAVFSGPPVAGRCPHAEYVFTAVVSTNGQPGRVSFEWIEPDGDRTPVRELDLARREDTAELRLDFTVDGALPMWGRATLRLLAPTPLEFESEPMTYPCP